MAAVQFRKMTTGFVVSVDLGAKGFLFLAVLNKSY